MNSYTSLIFKTFLVLSFFTSNLVVSQTDSNAVYKITNITISGNKKTKERIILRELVKHKEDTLTLKYLPYIKKRSEYNIFNTYLFIYDTISCNINDTLKTIDFSIKLKERWYIWPIPFVDFLDRNINTWWQTRDPERLNYGIALSLENFSGVKDRLIVIAKTGYANQLGFNYRLPFLNKKQTVGAYVQFLFTESNKLHYITTYNEQQFLISPKEHLRTEQSSRVGLFYRPHLFLQHSLDLYYYDISISDQIKKLNPNYFYNNGKAIGYFGMQYKLTFDNRDNKIYPLNGIMAELSIIKDGFDLSKNSNLNTTQGVLSLKRYVPLNKRMNLAMQARGRYLNGSQIPFAFNQALGYANYIRGYEYNVIDGQNYLLVKNSLRFQLIKPKYHEVAKLKKLKPFSTIPFYAYLNLFYDAAYVQEQHYKQTNDLANSWQNGYGIGIDFISYYDLVLRFEYSFNKQNQNGLFIHLTSGF